MDVAQIREIARIAIAVVGALSIYWGYRLFCKPSVQWLNAISGALLTVFGMGVLTADVRGVAHPPASQATPLQHTKPIGTGRHKPSADWLV